MGVHPSGEQFEIAHESWRAVIVEVGGGLRSLTVGDLDVLDGYAENEMCHDGRGELLFPWPNRIAGGRYHFRGQDYQLPLTEPARHNAIHGLVRWQRWSAERHSSNSVRITHRLFPSPGYPFMLDLAAEYSLAEGGLTVRLEATNIGADACPFGAGQHPYFRGGKSQLDGAVLQVPADSIYRYDDRMIPVERVPVAGTPLDFRSSRPIGTTPIDMDYTDLERGADGRIRITVQNPDGVTVEVWMDEAFKHATIYTGDGVQPASRRRQGIAVEPMTCPPNAFASGDDLLVLQPDETWSGTWGVIVRRDSH